MNVSPELLVIGGQTVVAALITIALLWYARLFREAEQRAQQIRALNEIVLTINASLDLTETFRAVIAGTHRILPFDRACIALLDSAGDAFEIIASTDEPSRQSCYPPRPSPATATLKPPRIPRAGSAAGWAVTHGQVWVANRLPDEAHRPDAGMLWKPDAAWCVVLPLVLRGKPIGVFSLSGSQRIDLDEELLEALRLIAEQVATATANAELYAEVEALARELEQRVEERTRELRKTQEQMMRSEKLAVAGRLAAAIAHEVNNPLQAMRLYLELLTEQPDSKAMAPEYLRVVQSQVDRIAGIVSQLLELYQPPEEAHTLVDLHLLVQEVLTLFDQRLQAAHISVQLDLAERLPPVSGARNGLRQVFLNVLLNAVEAMPNGGTLRVTSYATEDAVHITIADSGNGIAPADLPHVFDPFYTTKPNRSGLGLAVSHRIVQEHNGDFTIASEPGTGTTVHLSLPITASPSRRELSLAQPRSTGLPT